MSILNPFLVILYGAIYVIVLHSLYGNSFSLVPYVKSLVRGVRRVAAFFRKTFTRFGKFIADSWQFTAGAFFATLVLTSILYMSGATIKPADSTHASPIATIAPTNSAKRTVIDSTKPWVYDFSEQSLGSLDPKIWNVENDSTKADYNSELETFTNRTNNVRVENGVLVLEAKQEQKDGKAYTSGRIDTDGSFSFIYGTLEVDAKLPIGCLYPWVHYQPL